MGDEKKPGKRPEEKQPEPPPFDPDPDLITELEKGLPDGKPSKS